MDKTIQKVRTQLVLDHCFFGSGCLRLDVVENPANCETAYTDGKILGINTEYLKSLESAAQKSLLAHEVLHVVLLHHLRLQNRDITLANIAADHIVNEMLKDAGFTIPSDWIQGRGKGHSFESLYAELLKENKGKKGSKGGKVGNQPGQGGGQIIVGEVREPKGKSGEQLTEAERKELEQDGLINNQRDRAIAKAAGQLPGCIEKILTDILESRVDWCKELAEFFAQANRNDFSWRKYNKRFMPSGFYLPSLYDEFISIGILIDTSGSMSDEALRQVAGEVNGIRDFAKSNITVLYIDTKVAGVQEFEVNQPINLKAKGGGGTDFRPGFDWIQSHDKDFTGVIYLTDGYCSNFPAEPEYSVLWVLTEKNPSFKPPFGKVITIQ